MIETRGLTKSFGRTRALDGLDLSVTQGEVHGFLGPNGSGKTTTIRILLGLLKADGGTATLLGGDPWADTETLHRRIAYVPGDVSLWPNLTGGEVIDLLGRLRGGAGGVFGWLRGRFFSRRRLRRLCFLGFLCERQRHGKGSGQGDQGNQGLAVGGLHCHSLRWCRSAYATHDHTMQSCD